MTDLFHINLYESSYVVHIIFVLCLSSSLVTSKAMESLFSMIQCLMEIQAGSMPKVIHSPMKLAIGSACSTPTQINAEVWETIWMTLEGSHLMKDHLHSTVL